MLLRSAYRIARSSQIALRHVNYKQDHCGRAILVLGNRSIHSTAGVRLKEKDIVSPGIETDDLDGEPTEEIDVLEEPDELGEAEELVDDAPDVYMSESAKAKARARLAKMDKLCEQLLPDPTQEVPHLPNPDTWKKLMPRQHGFLRSHRWFVSNPTTADQVAQEVLKGVTERTTIVEGYPGPGIMSRAFLKQPCVEKVMALEINQFYRQGLQNLQQDPTSCSDPARLSIVPKSCYEWKTYNEILNGGHLDHIPRVREMRESKPDYSNGYFVDKAWQQPSPLTFFAQLPHSVHSEQLFSQLLRAICHRLWLFRFGRVRLAFLVSELVAKRCQAEIGMRERSKVTHIVNALADVKVLMPSSAFEPSEEHMYPGKINVGPSLLQTATSGPIKTARQTASVVNPDKRRLCLLLIEPKLKPLIEGDELDVFDYVTKNLFVLRSRPINEAINLLGAGAQAVVRQLNKGGHPALQGLADDISIPSDATPNTLTVDQMVAITRLFERWPFRPQHLFDEGNLSEVSERQLSF